MGGRRRAGKGFRWAHAVGASGKELLSRSVENDEADLIALIGGFISSDYSADYTRTAPGHNRNFDLRREFMGRADRAPIGVTSVFSGAFTDIIGFEMPVIRPRVRRVHYWGDAGQPLDFTARDDTASYTAAAALDDTAPRILRIAGDTVTARGIARDVSGASGEAYRTLRAGSVASSAP